jgi:hypothetical protein
MSHDTDITLETIDQLAVLKGRADLLSIRYHPSIGLEALREKINQVMAAKDVEVAAHVPATVVFQAAQESDVARRIRKKREANTLVRVRITCMNPAKKEHLGEIFTAGNSLVGSYTKFVPFNLEDGWHIPQIILTQIKNRECQVFTSTRDARGYMSRKGKLIKEFGIEVLDPLSPDELQELAQRQAMAKAPV